MCVVTRCRESSPGPKGAQWLAFQAQTVPKDGGRVHSLLPPVANTGGGYEGTAWKLPQTNRRPRPLFQFRGLQLFDAGRCLCPLCLRCFHWVLPALRLTFGFVSLRAPPRAASSAASHPPNPTGRSVRRKSGAAKSRERGHRERKPGVWSFGTLPAQGSLPDRSRPDHLQVYIRSVAWLLEKRLSNVFAFHLQSFIIMLEYFTELYEFPFCGIIDLYDVFTVFLRKHFSGILLQVQTHTVLEWAILVDILFSTINYLPDNIAKNPVFKYSYQNVIIQ